MEARQKYGVEAEMRRATYLLWKGERNVVVQVGIPRDNRALGFIFYAAFSPLPYVTQEDRQKNRADLRF